MTESKLLLIKKAFFDIAEREISVFESFPEADIIHSESYEKAINKLIEKNDPKKCKITLNRRLKVIIITATLIVALFITACVFRKSLLDFVERVFDDHTSFTSGEENKLLEKVYLPTYIPEGYVKEDYLRGPVSLYIKFTTDTNYISFQQSPLKANGSFTLDTEDEPYKISYIGEQPVYYICKNNTYSILWENGINQFILTAPADLKWEEIEKIIQGITLSEE